MAALATLAENEDIHPRLLHTGVTPFVAPMQSQSQTKCDIALMREATRVLANLSANWGTHSELAHSSLAAVLTHAAGKHLHVIL
jgi:hypothetical protein